MPSDPLYADLSRQYADSVRPLPEEGWPGRTHHALSHMLTVLAPHRQELRRILPSLLTDQESGLLSPAGRPSRDVVMAVYVEAAAAGGSEVLGRLLYLLQLGVLLWWLLDRSEDQWTTTRLVDLLGAMGQAAQLALWIPGVPERLAELDRLMRAGLLGEAVDP